MNRFRMAWNTVSVLALASVAFAQPGQDRPGGGFGPPGGGRGPGFGGGQFLDRMYDNLADELQLDDEQRVEFEAIKERQRTRMREMFQTFQQIREAESNGDLARADELRASLPDRPMGGGGPMGGVLDELEPILHVDQLDKLEEIRNRPPPGSEERLNRMAEELQLDEYQREQLDEAARGIADRFRNMGQQWQDLRPLYEQRRQATLDGDDALVEQLTQQIEESRPDPRRVFEGFFDEVDTFLTPDQSERLQQMRSRFAGGRGPGERLDQLGNDLQLDEVQREQFDGFRQELGEQFRAQGQQWQQLRPLMEERRDAEAAGDQQRVEELDAQIAEQRPQRGAIMDQFLDNVDGILYDNQRPVLEAFRQERQEQQQQWQQRGGGQQGAPGRQGLPGQREDDGNGARFQPDGGQQSQQQAGPQGAIFGLSEALDLNEQQREALEEAVRAARQQTGGQNFEDDAFVEQVVRNMQPHLSNEQMKSLKMIQGEVAEGETRPKDWCDFRLVLRAAAQLRLDRDQSEKLLGIRRAAEEEFKAFAKEFVEKQRSQPQSERGHEPSAPDGDARASDRIDATRPMGGTDVLRTPEMLKLGAEVKADVIDILQPAQVREFEARLRRLEIEQRIQMVREQRAQGQR